MQMVRMTLRLCNIAMHIECLALRVRSENDMRQATLVSHHQLY